MNPIRIIPGEHPLDLLARCDGYYHASNGAPLVGYAGLDEQGRQLVGWDYANFAKIETRGNALYSIVQTMLVHFHQIHDVDVLCAAPEGGKALAVGLALQATKIYIYP